MNKEVHYEGWLIKSPPSKRIWRSLQGWRRRWFTLKQGEIPEQFCLEYYTDRNCRKLKGVIDLDQCEQVDYGLRLENRKQKFQFMFAVKTPKRTYYLAADTEADMRDWVNCICQVCHLHDTKQSQELQDENRPQSSVASNSTTQTSLNTSTSGMPSLTSGSLSSSTGISNSSTRQSITNDILRRGTNHAVVDQQPHLQQQHTTNTATAANTYQNNSESAYVNTEYTNRETMLCDMLFDRQQLAPVDCLPSSPLSPGSGVYLNTSILQQHQQFQSKHTQQQQLQHENSRLVVNANGVVRKIPENLVLNNTPLPEIQQQSVQPSPALSTASGPYIPISECFSGSPKCILDGNNPTTPLNNLDPKFYDTPRSHNNIGLNLTNDQSYSPKITNCSLQQVDSTTSKNRSHRSDSDSESVFTDDDEWTQPLPLRENVDRSTRPSDSSIENESFVLTYSQRFSKLPDDATKEQQCAASTAATVAASSKHLPAKSAISSKNPLEKLTKVLKNKNNLILDFKDNEKPSRDAIPQLSDTENTSPAVIGPRDANSVVDESYDIPRSHNLPYYNMGQLYEGVTSPDVNPIAASTPNLMCGALNTTSPNSPTTAGSSDGQSACAAVAHVRTLPRPHCYTNAAPTKVEGNVFRYDFIDQGNLPPVNRKLKPKVNIEDKPPEEVPAKPPTSGAAAATAAAVAAAVQQNSPKNFDTIKNKFMTTTTTAAAGQVCPSTFFEAITSKLMTTNLQNSNSNESSGIKPPSVDRKLKPNVFKHSNATASTLATTTASARRSIGAPLSMMLSSDGENYLHETRTLPRQPRPNYAFATLHQASPGGQIYANNAHTQALQSQHHRTVSAVAAMPSSPQAPLQLPPKMNEHKLQYFDLDVANPPVINRQSMSVGNLNWPGLVLGRVGLSADPSARAPVRSSVVYNSVDFVKTEAFKRIREERKKESEGVNNSNSNTNANSTLNSSTISSSNK